MQINRLRRELTIKIVYCGPPFSGKTTNLERLYALLDPTRRSELTLLKNQEDRTLFFDYMQVEIGQVGGLTPRLNLYTVPGQVMYETTRQIVLRGADAVVFVADSSPKQLEPNLKAWRQLVRHLQTLQFNVQAFPLVLQLNKRDLPDALPVTMLTKLFDWQFSNWIEARASQDIGVRETLKAAVKAVLK